MYQKLAIWVWMSFRANWVNIVAVATLASCAMGLLPDTHNCSGGGENVPSITGACATRNFAVSGKRPIGKYNINYIRFAVAPFTNMV